MIRFKQIEERLKKEAKKLLESGTVAVVLAYENGYDEKHPMPYAAKPGPIARTSPPGRRLINWRRSS